MVSVTLLLWPAILNGGPLLFPDTTTYVRTADAAAAKTLGLRTGWTRESDLKLLTKAPNSVAATSIGSGSEQSSEARVPLKGRSPFYGALAYLSWLVSGFWLLLLLQALTVTTAIYFFLRHCGFTERTRAFFGTAACVSVLSVTTSVAFYASFVMPDVFAALLILGSSLLLLRFGEMGRFERGFWLLTIGAAAFFHSANLILIAGLIGIALLIRIFTRVRVSTSAMALLTAAAMAGVAAEAGTSVAVQKLTGAGPVRPPFMMARMIDDGPGYAYLVETCPGNGLLVCRYLDRLPLHSDTFLWGEKAPFGVFSTLSADEKRKLSDEELRFVVGVVESRPLGALQASLRSIARQASMVGLSEFNYEPLTREHLATRLPHDDLPKMEQTRAWRGAMPIAPFVTVFKAVLLISLVLLMLAVTHRRDVGLVIMLVGGILLNAIICGAMSTPHDRYQARVLWLMPLAAAGLVVGRRERRRPVPSYVWQTASNQA